MDVLIVGAGSMGRWFGATLDAGVAFADVDPTAAADAAAAIGGRAADPAGDETFEVVCLAVPIGAVEPAVDEYAGRAERAIVDVTGTMAGPLEAMAAAGPDLERASLHPLFAPERAPGSIAVVRDSVGPTIESLLAALEAAGNDLVETTATEHDDAMRSVQSAAHAAVLSFALAADDVPEGFETPIYEDLRELVRTVTDGTPRVYADIQRTFEGADAVVAAASRLAEADDREFEALYREAASRWQESPGTSGGGVENSDRDGGDDDDSGPIDEVDRDGEDDGNDGGDRDDVEDRNGEADAAGGGVRR